MMFGASDPVVIVTLFALCGIVAVLWLIRFLIVSFVSMMHEGMFGKPLEDEVD